MAQISRFPTSDEINPHYAAFVEPCVQGLGFCVRYSVGSATGYIADPRNTRRLKRFPTWIEAYDMAVRLYSDPDHPASEAA